MALTEAALRDSRTFVFLVPDEVQVVGRPASTPEEVFDRLLRQVYGEGNYTVLPLDAEPTLYKAALTAAIKSVSRCPLQVAERVDDARAILRVRRSDGPWKVRHLRIARLVPHGHRAPRVTLH